MTTGRRLSMLGVWSTIAFFCVWLVGYAIFARWIPPLSPDMTPRETADHYSEHAGAIRVGMVFMTLGSVLYLPWTALLAQIIRQVERSSRILSWTQLTSGVVAALSFMIPAYIWAAISFRPHRSPQVAQTLSDLGWLMFITAIGPFILQYATLAIAIFIDDRDAPAFPRWVGYLQVWVSLSFVPAVLAFFVKTGPFAWNGLMVWWIPLGTFSAWFAILVFYVRRAVIAGYADAPESGLAGSAAHRTDEVTALA